MADAAARTQWPRPTIYESSFPAAHIATVPSTAHAICGLRDTVNITTVFSVAGRHLGRHLEGRAQEEDVISQEAPTVHGWQRIERHYRAEQVLGMWQSQARAHTMPLLRRWYARLKQASGLELTTVAAIKTNIFGQLNWSIRRPTTKQSKQMARERREEAQRVRTSEPDPRKEKEDQIVKHTGWKR